MDARQGHRCLTHGSQRPGSKLFDWGVTQQEPFDSHAAAEVHVSERALAFPFDSDDCAEAEGIVGDAVSGMQ